MRADLDAVVVGAGPNGLAGAITLARAGRSVLVLEAAESPGGGARSAELTLPGFVHDVCSAIHPLAAVSPFFASVPLTRHGLELLPFEIPLAHPIDGGRAGLLYQSVDETVAGLGADGRAWQQLVGWMAARWDKVAPSVLGPVLRPPRHPLALAGFGLRGAPPATWVARRFSTDEGAGLFAGCAAHSFLPLNRPLSTSFGVMLAASGHRANWPAARGGTGAITQAMVDLLVELGGEVRTSSPVRSMADVPPSQAVLFDLTPRQLVAVAGDGLSATYRRRLERFRYGPGVFKVDYALREPVPWANEGCRRAGTVHLGGSVAEVAAAELDVARGRHPQRPFVLVGQQSLVDPGRAPPGRHTLWTYCHVPNGSDVDMTGAIESQIERFAPGFGDVVLARHAAGAGWYEDYNANNVG
ncbi:MAG: NAD(P)/FAD-dependent oxidoreductase, partial [Actinomycetota bacterium]|nr:NAD(P)/FAD-dependent oxidoreductase [Actinomycetota bacterium]